MNTTKYLQTDSRWSQLPYPKKPCRLGVCGCGELAINNAIIEMEQYKNYTPIIINPYCKQFAEARCNGTYHSGIPKMMKHYGLTEVKEHANMDSLWKELAKGDRVAIYLMGSRRGGSKKIHWTSSGHFVCSVDYKYKNGKHYVYVKDSYSNSKDRNGWITYEGNMRGDVSRVWSGKLNGAKASPAPTPTPTPTPKGKLAVDGSCGPATVKAMQRFFGTTVDGVISGQMKQYKSYYPSIHAIKYGKGGSAVVTALQKWLGLSGPYGIIGPNTTKAWQKRLRDYGYFANPKEPIDGIFGVKSMKAWQECLNNNGKPKSKPTPTPTPTPTPEPTLIDKEMDACKVQADWMKNAAYKWESKPTVPKSKKKGTCVTYVACVLQRIGILKSGQYIWQNGKGYGTGKVYGTNDKMTTTYMDNKTFTACKSKLKKGDIVLCDDNKSGEAGSGGHIMIFSAFNKDGKPLVWDNTCAKTGKRRAYGKSRKILAIVRLK